MKFRLLFLVLLPVVLLAGCQEADTNAVVNAYGNKDYLGAMRISGKRIQGGGANRIDRILHAWSLFQLGYFDKALREFQALARQRPTEFHAWLGQGWVMIKKGRFDRATHYLDEAQRWMGQWQRPMLFAARGWLAFYKKEYDRAAALFDLTQQSLYFEDKEYIPIPEPLMETWETLPWVGKGWVAIVKGQLDKADNYFKRGLVHDASCHLCYAGLSEVAARNGALNDAIDLAVKGLSVVRHDNSLTAQLNRLLWKKNDLALSKQIYEKLVKTSRGDSLYLANLGYLYLYRGEADKAEQLFHEALRKEPGLILAKRGLALIARPTAQ